MSEREVPPPERATTRTYEVRTYGCQMNVHDSERLSGLLEEAGYVRAADGRTPDVVVLQHLRGAGERRQQAVRQPRPPAPGQGAHPGMQIAVGGCLAQKDRGEIVRRAPWVDVVFGTHNIGSLPVLLERARVTATRRRWRSSSRWRSSRRRCRPGASRRTPAWVSISVGCNNTCTFCIVPSLRGKEKDRRPGDILAEVEALVAEGVLEVTLLGQNVNSYGVEFGDRLRVRQAAARLRRRSTGWSGSGSPRRTRATSPTT